MIKKVKIKNSDLKKKMLTSGGGGVICPQRFKTDQKLFARKVNKTFKNNIF